MKWIILHYLSCLNWIQCSAERVDGSHNDVEVMSDFRILEHNLCFFQTTLKSQTLKIAVGSPDAIGNVVDQTSLQRPAKSNDRTEVQIALPTLSLVKPQEVSKSMGISSHYFHV